MLRTLRHYLKNLWNSANDNIGQDLVEDIARVSLQEMTQSDDKAVGLSLLLSSKQLGLCHFLLTDVTLAKNEKTRFAIMKLFYSLLFTYGNQLQPFASILQYASLKVIRGDKVNKAKVKAFDVIIALHRMKLFPQSYNASSRNSAYAFSSNSNSNKATDDEYFISHPALINSLFFELNMTKSKLPASVRGLIFSTLGFLSEMYPDAFAAANIHPNVAVKQEDVSSSDGKESRAEGKNPISLAMMCMHALEHEMNAGDKMTK
jgi:hypothetical protein